MEKKMNKGFSLVELIIVIAIMAVLVGILAPQFLRYVEKSRLQKDNSAVAEVANAAKSAMANEAINTATTLPYTISFTGGTATNFSATATDVEGELAKVVGESVTLTSNTYNGATVTLTIQQNTNTKTIEVVGSGIMDDPDSTATTKVY